MGDRTIVGLTIHPDDTADQAWRDFIEDCGESEDESYPWDWSATECNYALYSPLETLAKHGVRFIGAHGSGGDYAAGEFYSDGDGTVYYAPDETWSRCKIVVDVNSGLDDVDQDNLLIELAKLNRYLALVKEISRAEKARLTNRPS